MTTPTVPIFWRLMPTSVIKTHSAALQEHTTQCNANVHLLTSVGILQKSYCNACAFVTPRAGWLCVFTQICIGGHYGHHNVLYDVTTTWSMWGMEVRICCGPQHNTTERTCYRINCINFLYSVQIREDLLWKKMFSFGQLVHLFRPS